MVGIVTNRDLRFETRLDAPVREIMTPRERLITVREGAIARRRQGADAQAQARARAGRQRRLRAARPDDGEGHHQADQLPRTPRAMRTASCASAPRSASARAPRSASSCWSRPASMRIVVDTAHGHSAGVIERVRWVKRNYPKRRRDRRQHRHRRGGAGAGRGRRRRGEGRHRPGLDLHHAHRHRRRRAADHGDRQRSPRRSPAAACR